MHSRIGLIAQAVLLSLPAVAAPTITFDPSAVTISGLNPGSQVAWFSIARERDEWVTNVVRREGVEVADAQGTVSLPYDPERSANSAWAAVDLTTGDVAVGTPLVNTWHLVSATAKAEASALAASLGSLQDHREFLELLVARPGEAGAWGLSVGDGGDADADGNPDGTIHASLADLRPLATVTAAARSLRAGDVIVAIDPGRAELFSVRIGQPKS